MRSLAAEHVEEVHAAEEAVEEIEHSQARLREKARQILGITGRHDEPPPLREGIARSGVGWYTLLALSALVVVDQFQNFAFSILGPEISRSLGISKSVIAFMVLLKTLALMLAALPVAGYVQHRAKRGIVAVIAAWLWSIFTLLSGFVATVWEVLGVLVADGMSTGAVRATHTPLIVDAYPPEVRVRGLSFHQAAYSAGTVVAPLTVGLLSAVLGFTWRGVFVIMGVMCMLAALFASRLRDPGFGRWDEHRIRDAVREDAGGDGERLPDENVDLRFFEIVRRLLLVPTVRLVMVANAFIGMMLFPLYTFLFFYLDERWNMGPGARSVFFAGVFAVVAAAVAWFGRRGERLFREDPARMTRVVANAMFVCAGGLALGVSSPVLAGVFIGFAVVLTIVIAMDPALTAVLYAMVPPRTRPHLAALSGIFLAGVGGVAGVLLLNGIDRRFGISGAIVSLMVPAIIAGFVLRAAARSVNDDLDHMIDEVVEREEISIVQRSGRHLPMLACRHVDFSYGQLQVLFDVNFTVDDGEMVALLGTNGAGKSTLLRVISGLGLPSRGSVTFRGADITYLDAERRLGLGVTQIPGGKATFGPLTVVDNLRVFGHSIARDARKVNRGIEATFEAFPRLGERHNQLASTLSGGEQQMLALGKAFILEPRLLLIDELSLGLAPKVVSELLEMVRRINDTGTAVVLVEQSVNIALSLVDHAYFMEKGEIRFDGPAPELLERRDLLRSVFLEGASKGLA